MELQLIIAGVKEGIINIPQIEPTTLVLLTFAGVLLFEILIYIILFKKPRIDEAIVRTGAGGIKTAVHNGIIILPFFHKYKVVCMCQHTLLFDFTKETKLFWTNSEEFEGKIYLTLQIPLENPTMIISAARNLQNTSDPSEILKIIEPAFRASIREQFRTFRHDTFDFEPSMVEVRLSRSLDLVAFAFGLKIRAVYIHSSETKADSKSELPQN